MFTHYFLGFSAGGLSLLAPCVLPLLPLILTSSLKTSKFGPLAMSLGLVVSFSGFGILTGLLGHSFDPKWVRNFGAIVLIVIGLVFLIPSFKLKFSSFMSKLSSYGAQKQNLYQKPTLLNEFLSGGLLGLIWSPCTGPTLAFAVGLASQGESLVHAFFIFFFFGLGAGLSLLALGSLVRKFSFLKIKILQLGEKLNTLMGLVSLTLGILILTGWEVYLDEWIISITPTFILELSTKF